MTIDISDIQIKTIDVTIDYVESIQNGFIPTDKDLCRMNAFTILCHIERIVEELTDRQKEKVLNLYNSLTI